MNPKPCECDPVKVRARHVNLDMLEREQARLEMMRADALAALNAANESFTDVDERLNAVKELIRLGKEYVDDGKFTKHDY